MMSSKHVPVLLDEVLEFLNLKDDSTIIDLTLGRGGHSKEILKRIPNGHLYAFDKDIEAIEESRKVLSKVSNNFTLINDDFTTLNDYLQFYKVKQVDGILLDLGVSSPQFDTPIRGFSYRYDGPLDMRMDQKRNHLTAEIIVNTYPEEKLSKIFTEYGECKYANKIAKAIVTKREEKPITTTLELVDVIKEALPARELKKQGHPAKTIFQALRIEVNDELERLEVVLKEALKALGPNGRLVVISFHSLEDRIVKNTFKEIGKIIVPNKYPNKNGSTKEYPYILVNLNKVVVASNEEINKNPRAKSAKLRVIARSEGGNNA
jgi:16S rRNA (cytosine1402-N4)-methyltransferase